jgi:hypothetical protein
MAFVDGVLVCDDCQGSIPAGKQYYVAGRVVCATCGRKIPALADSFRIEVDCQFGINAHSRYLGVRGLSWVLVIAATVNIIAAVVIGQERGTGLEIVILLLGCLTWIVLATGFYLLRRILICLEAALGEGKTPKYGSFGDYF